MEAITAGLILAGKIFDWLNTRESKENSEKVKEIELELQEEWGRFPFINHAKVEALSKQAIVYMNAASRDMGLHIGEKKS